MFLLVECWDHTVEIVTVSAVSIIIYILIVLEIAAVVSPPKGSTASKFAFVVLLVVLVPPMLFAFLGPFYSDWVLGAIARNFAGLPTSTDTVVVGIYWAFFATCLLPLVAL